MNRSRNAACGIRADGIVARRQRGSFGGKPRLSRFLRLLRPHSSSTQFPELSNRIPRVLPFNDGPASRHPIDFNRTTLRARSTLPLTEQAVALTAAATVPVESQKNPQYPSHSPAKPRPMLLRIMPVSKEAGRDATAAWSSTSTTAAPSGGARRTVAQPQQRRAAREPKKRQGLGDPRGLACAASNRGARAPVARALSPRARLKARFGRADDPYNPAPCDLA